MLLCKLCKFRMAGIFPSPIYRKQCFNSDCTSERMLCVSFTLTNYFNSSKWTGFYICCSGLNSGSWYDNYHCMLKLSTQQYNFLSKSFVITSLRKAPIQRKAYAIIITHSSIIKSFASRRLLTTLSFPILAQVTWNHYQISFFFSTKLQQCQIWRSKNFFCSSVNKSYKWFIWIILFWIPGSSNYNPRDLCYHFQLLL